MTREYHAGIPQYRQHVEDNSYMRQLLPDPSIFKDDTKNANLLIGVGKALTGIAKELGHDYAQQMTNEASSNADEALLHTGNATTDIFETQRNSTAPITVDPEKKLGAGLKYWKIDDIRANGGVNTSVEKIMDVFDNQSEYSQDVGSIIGDNEATRVTYNVKQKKLRYQTEQTVRRTLETIRHNHVVETQNKSMTDFAKTQQHMITSGDFADADLKHGINELNNKAKNIALLTGQNEQLIKQTLAHSITTDTLKTFINNHDLIKARKVLDTYKESLSTNDYNNLDRALIQSEKNLVLTQDGQSAGKEIATILFNKAMNPERTEKTPDMAHVIDYQDDPISGYDPQGKQVKLTDDRVDVINHAIAGIGNQVLDDETLLKYSEPYFKALHPHAEVGSAEWIAFTNGVKKAFINGRDKNNAEVRNKVLGLFADKINFETGEFFNTEISPMELKDLSETERNYARLVQSGVIKGIPADPVKSVALKFSINNSFDHFSKSHHDNPDEIKHSLMMLHASGQLTKDHVEDILDMVNKKFAERGKQEDAMGLIDPKADEQITLGVINLQVTGIGAFTKLEQVRNPKNWKGGEKDPNYIKANNIIRYMQLNPSLMKLSIADYVKINGKNINSQDKDSTLSVSRSVAGKMYFNGNSLEVLNNDIFKNKNGKLELNTQFMLSENTDLKISEQDLRTPLTGKRMSFANGDSTMSINLSDITNAQMKETAELILESRKSGNMQTYTFRDIVKHYILNKATVNDRLKIKFSNYETLSQQLADSNKPQQQQQSQSRSYTLYRPFGDINYGR